MAKLTEENLLKQVAAHIPGTMAHREVKAAKLTKDYADTEKYVDGQKVKSQYEKEIDDWLAQKKETYDKTGMPQNCAYALYVQSPDVASSGITVKQLNALDDMVKRYKIVLDTEQNPWLGYKTLYSDNGRMQDMQKFAYAVSVLDTLFDESKIKNAYKNITPEQQKEIQGILTKGKEIASSGEFSKLVQAIDERMNDQGPTDKELRDKRTVDAGDSFSKCQNREEEEAFILSILSKKYKTPEEQLRFLQSIRIPQTNTQSSPETTTK